MPKGNKRMMPRSIKMKQLPAAVRMASTGEFVTTTGSLSTGQTWNSGTGYPLWTFGGLTTATLISSLHIKLWFFSAAVRQPGVLAVIKAPDGVSAESYDITDSDVLNKLRAEGRLFYHDWHYRPAVASDAIFVPKPIEFKYINVRLDAEEELSVVWRPLGVNTADGAYIVCTKYSATDL